MGAGQVTKQGGRKPVADAAAARRTRMRIVRSGAAGPAVDVLLTEVSRQGVSLVHDEALDAGDQLMLVSAGTGPDDPPAVLLFTVAKCQAHAESGGFLATADFTRIVFRRPTPAGAAVKGETPLCLEPPAIRLAFVA